MFVQNLLKINKLFSALLMWLAGGALLIMVGLAVANMVLRPMGLPIRGTYELVGFFGALVIAFGMASAENSKSYEVISLLHGHFPPFLNKALDVLAHLACAVFFALMAWSTAEWALALLRRGELSETLRFNYVLFPAAVALGLAAMTVAILCSLMAMFCPQSKPQPLEIIEDEPK